MVLMASVCMMERYMLFPQGSPLQSPRFTNSTKSFRVCQSDLQDFDYDNYDKLSSWWTVLSLANKWVSGETAAGT